MSTAKRAALLVALLGALGVIAGLAFAASGPPTPTITSHPASRTTSTSASFSFTDSQSKVTFRCSLDGSSFTSCTSPKSYSNLKQGTHTFSVKAVNTSGVAGNAASFTWTIDGTAPAITITFPSNGSDDNAAKWSVGCSSGAGVCGTATDPSGVALVSVSIKQNATGKFWSGSAYSSTSESYHTATRSSTSTSVTWRYGLPLPSPDGQYTVHVVARDGLGNNSSSPTASVFTIDTVAPPAPAITSEPANPTNQTSASFSFSDTQSGLRFFCKLDSGSFAACTSPKSYSSLAQGSHTFSVVAEDAATNFSRTTSYLWVVDTTPPPAPSVTGEPTNPTTDTAATFTYTDTEAGVRFQCKLDTAAFAACASPTNYTGLSLAQHTFSVRALDAAGNVSSTTSYTWTIQSTTGMPFSITGTVPNPLYPGMPAQAIPLKLSNPNNVAIFVTSLGANVQAISAGGCLSSWFQVGAANIPSGGIQIPANGQVTVATANDPTLQMLESGTNQDVCKGASLTLAYTGSAHS